MDLSEYIDDFGDGTKTVTRVAVQAKRHDRVSVFIDGEFAFGLADEVAVRHGLAPGVPVDRTLLEALHHGEEETSCKRVAIRYVSYRMRSIEEVRRRLAKDGAANDAIQSTVDHLKEIGLLDDAVFAKAFARDAVLGKKWGPHRIAGALKRLGVASNHIEDALGESRNLVDDEALVEQLAVKRWTQLGSVRDPVKRKKRVYDYLVRRGFDFDEIRRAIADLEP